VGRNEKNLKKKKIGFGKKKFASETDTEIGPWFRFSVPKPNFGLTVAYNNVMGIICPPLSSVRVN
jgi:hypothetical protein